MIDTDKYEGHTEGLWEYDSATIHATAKGGNEIIAEYPCWNYNKDQLITKEEEANLRLMADAPLLLEEVKRHRPPKVDGKYMAWSDSHPKHDRRTWIEQVMEGVTDVGYWTWVNWQLQYGDDEE